MRPFHDRINAAHCRKILRAAADRGFLQADTTSLIVHELTMMRERIRTLRHAFPDGTLHALAIKANPLVEVLRIAVQCGMGLEAASMEEVHLALAAGCPPNQIVFDSPAKTHEEIREALDLGILLNANSFDELVRIEAALELRPSQSLIGLRVNPHMGPGEIAHTSVAEKESKFGVSVSSMRNCIVESFRRWDWLRGLHIHVGSQGCGPDMLVGAVRKANQLRRDIEFATRRSLDFVDIGGGLPAVYHSNHVAPTPNDYANQLHSVTNELTRNNTRLITEFGRAIQAGCGLTVSRVEYVNQESSTAVIHVGADLLMRPVYASQDWRHEFFVLSDQFEPKRTAVRPWTIAGPLCFSGDIIGRHVDLPEIEPGDWIVIRDTGAYTLSMWSRHCSRSIPLVVGYDDANESPLRVLRQAEAPASLVRFWSKDSVTIPGVGCALSPSSVSSLC